MKTKLLTLIMLLYISTVGYGQSPYISKIHGFHPAPGQFTNDLPEYEKGDTHKDLIRKAEEAIVGEQKSMISLGGYGGYILFGFDHMIENKAGKYDFKIWGNAFYSNSNPNPDASAEGGSCEPGIVMVSYDANGNGNPDDAWYELAGSEYFKSGTIHKYQITYHRPDPDKTPTPNKEYPFLNDTTYIKWNDNQGLSGYIYRNTFHSQPYFPLWEDLNILEFNGTLLANNYVDESGDGSYFVQYAYRWGYVDNHPNNDDRSSFDIGWAVDDEGNPVHLPGIHFVKVYTAVNQYCGWLGETSTEIMGAEDLHLQNKDIDIPAYTEGIRVNHSETTLNIGETEQLTARVFSSNPSIESVIWRSNDETVATVSQNGTIQAINRGTTEITATTLNGLFSDSCKVIVTKQTSDTPNKTQDQPKAIFSNGTLHLINWDTYSCVILSTNGVCKESFNVSSNNEVRHIALPSGIYILKGQKQDQIQTFKIIIF